MDSDTVATATRVAAILFPRMSTDELTMTMARWEKRYGPFRDIRALEQTLALLEAELSSRRRAN